MPSSFWKSASSSFYKHSNHDEWHKGRIKNDRWAKTVQNEQPEQPEQKGTEGDKYGNRGVDIEKAVRMARISKPKNKIKQMLDRPLARSYLNG